MDINWDMHVNVVGNKLSRAIGIIKNTAYFHGRNTLVNI